jgi:hypothetical protein
MAPPAWNNTRQVIKYGSECGNMFGTSTNSGEFLGGEGVRALKIDSHLEFIRGTKFPKSQSLYIHELAHEQQLLYSHSVLTC